MGTKGIHLLFEVEKSKVHNPSTRRLFPSMIYLQATCSPEPEYLPTGNQGLHTRQT